MKYKKGFAQYWIFLIFLIVILLFMFLGGTITSLILKNTFNKIPTWFWIGLVIFVLFALGGKKK